MSTQLKEAALKFANDNSELYESSNHGSMYFCFYWGAQWQQERMYSEEYLKEAFSMGRTGKTIEEFNRKFKKK